jgi:hypothetical protein
MTALHDSSIGGHSGFPVTYHRIKKLFYWVDMKGQIKEFVQSCEICKRPRPIETDTPVCYCHYPYQIRLSKLLAWILFLDYLPPTDSTAYWW